jgi:hypothetical protein
MGRSGAALLVPAHLLLLLGVPCEPNCFSATARCPTSTVPSHLTAPRPTASVLLQENQGEGIQVLRYEHGQEYKPHFDVSSSKAGGRGQEGGQGEPGRQEALLGVLRDTVGSFDVAHRGRARARAQSRTAAGCEAAGWTAGRGALPVHGAGSPKAPGPPCAPEPDAPAPRCPRCPPFSTSSTRAAPPTAATASPPSSCEPTLGLPRACSVRTASRRRRQRRPPHQHRCHPPSLAVPPAPPPRTLLRLSLPFHPMSLIPSSLEPPHPVAGTSPPPRRAARPSSLRPPGRPGRPARRGTASAPCRGWPPRLSKETRCSSGGCGLMARSTEAPTTAAAPRSRAQNTRPRSGTTWRAMPWAESRRSACSTSSSGRRRPRRRQVRGAAWQHGTSWRSMAQRSMEAVHSWDAGRRPAGWAWSCHCGYPSAAAPGERLSAARAASLPLPNTTAALETCSRTHPPHPVQAARTA